MSSKNISFDEFFSQIPFIPMVEICKHLRVPDVILLSLHTDRFLRAIESGGIRNEAVFNIRIVPRSYQLSVKFADNLSNSFVINYTQAEFYGSTETTTYFLSPVPDREVDIGYHCHTFSRYSGEAENLERSFLDILKMVCKVFQAKPFELSMTMRQQAVEFADKLLLSLPLEPVNSLKLAFDNDKGEEVLVKGKTIKSVLEWIECRDELFLGGNMDESFTSDYLKLNVLGSLTLLDARFLTANNLQNFQFQHGHFGINNLTSEDFQTFLKSWTDRPRRHCRLKCAKFLISDNQKICSKEVLKGLDACAWDREVRDRGMFLRDNSIIDLKDGMDIRKTGGRRIGTVLITDNQLLLIVWTSSMFPLRDKLCSLKFYIPIYEKRLKRLYKEKEELAGRYATSRWNTMDHEMLVNENEILKTSMQLQEAQRMFRKIKEFLE